MNLQITPENLEARLRSLITYHESDMVLHHMKGFLNELLS